MAGYRANAATDRQMIDRCMRFKDQMDIADDGRKRLKPVTQEG